MAVAQGSKRVNKPLLDKQKLLTTLIRRAMERHGLPVNHVPDTVIWQAALALSQR